MTMICILTKYHPPTNFRGARISARTGDNRPSTGKPDRLTISYPYELSIFEGHAKAAKALAEREGWGGVYVAGDIGEGCAFTRLVISANGTLPALAAGQVAFVVGEPEVAAASDRERRDAARAAIGLE